jgi:hypothetical protein
VRRRKRKRRERRKKRGRGALYVKFEYFPKAIHTTHVVVDKTKLWSFNSNLYPF